MYLSGNDTDTALITRTPLHLTGNTCYDSYWAVHERAQSDAMVFTRQQLDKRACSDILFKLPEFQS